MTGLTRLARMRWWHLSDVLTLERQLFGADRWTAAMFWSELAEHATRHYLIAVGESGDVIGYAGLCTYATEAYVQTLAVRADRQGSGMGRDLLVALLAEADRRRVTTVALEVRADNATAQRLYLRHGFELAGLRRGYYQPSGADAVVMVRAG
ncbi:MAG: ribosomal-protein-alanine N-acetyltransferase [Pseudonocardiales bacterium]|nr:MAG: ribosomal-protein-alanine N-acetyltransferase [Pseudonocardiales bacterium]